MNQQVYGCHAGALHIIFQMLHLATSHFQNIASEVAANPTLTPTHPTEVYIIPNNRVFFYYNLLNVIIIVVVISVNVTGGKIPIPKFPQLNEVEPLCTFGGMVPSLPKGFLVCPLSSLFPFMCSGATTDLLLVISICPFFLEFNISEIIQGSYAPLGLTSSP